MIRLARLWTKLAVAILLVVGCHIAAPAISLAANAAVLTSDMPCHETHGESDAVPTPCGKAYLAIPATAAALPTAIVAPAAIFAAQQPVFIGQFRSPDTPPPRRPEQA